jgi:hypothetical protein
MKKPLPTRVPMQEPKQPVRSVTRPVYHELPIRETLQEAVDELARQGVPLNQVTISEDYDRWGEHDCYSANWTTHETVTQTDDEWAKTCAQYEADMAFYAKDKALYEASMVEYHTKLAAYETWLTAEQRRNDLAEIHRLLSQYPDYANARP